MRISSIQELRTIVDQVAEDHEDIEERRSALLSVFRQIQVPLSAQLLDLRSVLTKHTITVLIYFAEVYP